MSYPEPTKSKTRLKIMELVEKKALTAAQVGDAIGFTRERAYNMLLKMDEARQVKKITRSSQVFWGKYTPPAKVERQPRVHAGTMTEPLSLSYMNSVHRPGAMDAYAIASRGIKA